MEKLKILIFSFSMILVAVIILIFWRMGDVLESPGIYNGSLSYGFEGRGFIPCKFPDEVWWVEEVDNDIAMKIHYSTTGDHYKPAYATIKTEVSSKGSHGHMGMYDRTTKIINVLSISTNFPDGCTET